MQKLITELSSAAHEREPNSASSRPPNNGVTTFPNVLIAGRYGFKAKPYFAAEAGAEKPPRVQFDFGGKSAPAK